MTAENSEFDEFSDCYEASLTKGLQLSGESPQYFAELRVAWVQNLLQRCGKAPKRILDFGCGTGGSVKHLLDAFTACSVTGVDPSSRSLQVARKNHDPAVTSFIAPEQVPLAAYDLAFCNGVFHHILPADRSDSLKLLFDALIDGGCLAFWENNPWNPGTRMVMSRIPFDRDAITINPFAAVSLLKSARFEVIRRDSLFWFPRMLSRLRPLESLLVRIPLGAQYLVLCQKNLRGKGR
jgi:SAM-dependent methyltransferase